ncbi:hypothetical protein [Celeribacter halophilus]|uniref:hypothetical protein n=1 Tax=Celeribacter halophilus TaxID=576117 RepID=UPI003A91B511
MTFQNTRKRLLALSISSNFPREVIRQFTPNWFAATMGTGILSIAQDTSLWSW